MLRKIAETFTATHFTILVGIAILAPNALFATVATTAVSITDPDAGTKSFVDAGRKLYVYDPIAGYQNYPVNYVRTRFTCNGGSNSSSNYTPPAGKAFILKSVDFHYFDGTSGSDNYMYLVNGNFIFTAIEGVDSAGSRTAELGAGYYLRNGESITTICGTGSYAAQLLGYLVPSNQVPPANAVGQSVAAGSAIMKNGRPM